MNKYVINEEFLQQVETLQLILKNNTSGMFGGNHQSKTFGSSSDFTDYREYMPGDDVTKIDWNAYARFQKLYLKLFLDERQVHTRIYIDASRSMDYGRSDKASKAIEIAATFAYLSICEMDKVSVFYIKDSKIYDVMVNVLGKESYYNSIGKLNEIEFDGDSYISDSIIPSTVGYGDGLSIIISDFLTDNNYESAIDHLISKRRDVLCIQVLDKEEIKPTIRGKSHFIDCEDSNKIYRKNINKDVAIAYQKALEFVKDRIRSYCIARNASYMMVSSNEKINNIFLKDLPDKGVVK